jgi:hypothetical protein
MFLRTRHLLLGLLLLVPGGLASSQEAEKPPVVAWQELVDHPSRYLGKTITLYAQFHGRVEGWSPYLTRFCEHDFSAYQFWSDEQFPWRQSEYAMPRVRLFARHGQPGEWAFADAQPYARYELRVRVRELFLDLPWAEIENATRTLEEISEGTNIHAARGIELCEKNAFALAQTEFEHALEGLLPAHARAELEQLLEASKDAQGRKPGR